MVTPLTRPTTLGLMAWLVACSSHSGPVVTVDVSGAQGTPIPATNVTDVLVVDVSVNGAEGTLVVDTGSPIVTLDPSAFPTSTLPDGAGAVRSLTLGALTFADLSIVAADFISSPDPTLPIDGSLGCGILCAFPVALNYRDSTVTLGATSSPAHVEDPGISIPMSLEGGGLETLDDVPGSVSFPRSRIVVTVTIEGSPHTLVVDSGSSTVVLRTSIFDALVTDGRGQLANVTTAAVGGDSTSSVTRIRSFALGGEEASGIIAAAGAALDPAFDSLATEIGAPVDGVVGGSFLRQFYVTIDYPNGALELRRYTEGGPTFDVFDRIGVAVTPATGSDESPPVVSTVFAGTDADTRGVKVGDVIDAIDGTALAGLGQTRIDALLSGVVGTKKSVTFGTTASASLSHVTVSIAVNDVIPL